MVREVYYLIGRNHKQYFSNRRVTIHLVLAVFQATFGGGPYEIERLFKFTVGRGDKLELDIATDSTELRIHILHIA